MQPTARAVGKNGKRTSPSGAKERFSRTRFATAPRIFLDRISSKQIIYSYKYYPLDNIRSLTIRLESTGGQVSVGRCPEMGH